MEEGKECVEEELEEMFKCNNEQLKLFDEKIGSCIQLIYKREEGLEGVQRSNCY